MNFDGFTGGKDPLDQLFEDMDESFLKENALLQEIGALEQTNKGEGNIPNIETDIFLNPFQENKPLKSEAGVNVMRNSKSMLDFSSLPSARRGSFSFGSNLQNPTFKAEQPQPQVNQYPKVAISSSISRKPQTVRKKSGKKVGFQVDGTQGTKKKSGKRETAEEKRQRRLARNRESARQSRRRKKLQLENIEQQVVNLALRLNEERQEFFDTCYKKRQQAKLDFLNNIQQLPSSHQLVQQIQYYDTVFGADDFQSNQLRQFHFYHACDSLLPQYFRFFLHVVGSCSNDIGPRKKTVASTNVAKTTQQSAWERFTKDLGLSNAQKEKLRSDLKSLYAPEAETEQANLFSLVSSLQGLKKSFDLRTTVVQTQVKALFGVLDPAQVSKFLLFFEQSFDKQNSRYDKELSTHNLKQLIEENNIELDDQTKQAMDFLEIPEEKLSLEDLKQMIQIVGR